MASILNVDKVRATGSTTDGLLVDSSGRVTQPAKPAWTVKMSPGAYVALGVTPVIFDVADVNRGSMYSTSTGVVTIPVAGVYNIVAMAYLRIDAGEDAAVRIMKSTDGGSNYTLQTYAYHYLVGATQIHITLTNNILLDLNQGDKLRVDITGSADYYSGSGETRFSGHLVG